MQGSLRPDDVVVALLLAMEPGVRYERIADTIGISMGGVTNSTRRLARARLLLPGRREPDRRALHYFIRYGVPHCFAAELGAIARGVPTAHAAPPLAAEISRDDPIVWPSASGTVRGQAIAPLTPGAVKLPQTHPYLYEAVVLVDAIRVGRAREREIAARLLDRYLAPIEHA